MKDRFFEDEFIRPRYLRFQDVYIRPETSMSLTFKDTIQGNAKQPVRTTLFTCNSSDSSGKWIRRVVAKGRELTPPYKF